jgi:hypothetical protein
MGGCVQVNKMRLEKFVGGFLRSLEDFQCLKLFVKRKGTIYKLRHGLEGERRDKELYINYVTIFSGL